MRARNAIIGIVTALLAIVSVQAPALADTRDDLISTDEAFGVAFEDFLDVFNSPTADVDQVVDATNAFAAEAARAADAFRGHAAAAGDATLRGFSEQLAVASDDMSEAAASISAAILAQDEGGYSAGIDALNAASDDYAAIGDAFNTYLADNPIASGDPMYALWFVLLIVSILFLVGAIVLLVLGRRQHGALAARTDRKGNTSQTTLRGLRWTLLGLAAVFVVGAAIPFVQYWFIAHDGGGEYRVFWYPLAIGGVGTIVVAVQYLIAVRRVRRDGSAMLLGDAPQSEAPQVAEPQGQPPAPEVPATPQTMLNGQPLPPEPPR